MTEYTGIKGGKVQNFSSDPANPFVGQVWYNTTSSELKDLDLRLQVDHFHLS